MTPCVFMMSIWRNDADRFIDRRIKHLLDKSWPNLRFLWLVGDSTDATEDILRAVPDERVTVLHKDTNLPGEDPNSRIRRLTQVAHDLLDNVPDDVDYCVLHDSDLITPDDVIERFFATGKCPIAGFPVLGAGSGVFYDTLGFVKDGVHFTNQHPYHACYRPNELFEVDSFGACYMFPAADARSGLRPRSTAMVGFSRLLKEKYGTLWVDPTIEVVQPVDLWTPQVPPQEE